MVLIAMWGRDFGEEGKKTEKLGVTAVPQRSVACLG